MVDYSMCTKTITVYRKAPEGIIRRVIEGCFLQWEEQTDFDQDGVLSERTFLLIQPGQEQLVFCGDRVFDGIGPKISLTDWEVFVPSAVAGLGEVNYTRVYRWEGEFCHTEAGRS